jgi:DNA-binding winged helix-turn-helix (wHTH) protein
MSQETKRFYEFDRFRIDLTERVLLCEGEMAPLTQKAFEVLLALIERRGRIVSKEELMEKVWPDTFVEESNLAQNIYTLRKTLGQAADGASGGGYIVTVPRRGYRFAAEVREILEEDRPLSEPASKELETPVAGAAPPVQQPASAGIAGWVGRHKAAGREHQCGGRSLARWLTDGAAPRRGCAPGDRALNRQPRWQQ